MSLSGANLIECLITAWHQAVETLTANIWTPILLPFSASQRIYWFYLASALVMAAGIFLWQQRAAGRSVSVKGMAAYLFPRQVLFHPSAVADYQYFLMNILLKTLVIVPVFALLTPTIAGWVEGALEPVGLAGVFGRASVGIVLLVTVLAAMATDFAIFLAHYVQHKVPAFWEFHKTHHSAEVLTPITVYRMHPVDDLLTVVFVGVISGGVLGGVQYLFEEYVPIFTVVGLNILVYLYYLLGYNLRHTHVWLDYGPLWSRVFISPAQHQIHHSSSPKHYDKNLGFMFAWWDGLFGTLYVPDKQEDIIYGIGGGEDKAFQSPLALYFQPFKVFYGKFRQLKGSVFVLFLLILFGFLYVNKLLVGFQSFTPPPINEDNVFLETLTWPQVEAKVQGGVTTVLVPTGGVEQNGPHMILGKHNYIVRQAAAQIAQKLDNTLVAPVLTYVPEGDIEPATGHMRYAGTLSVPDQVFADVLEATARSLKAHGFKLICFLGDSGGNQMQQEAVAQKLTTLWQGEGVRVLHVKRYYIPQDQIYWLSEQGLSPAQIGTHAGIRDTSELLAVYPQGVDLSSLDKPLSGNHDSGFDGNPRMASKAYGRFLLNMRVQAAVRQIKRVKQQP
ncbi:MAG: creatininase family protein [Vampirovibrio sp.]|nr:creatininase family protein [Vampirovibrio sp.]